MRTDGCLRAADRFVFVGVVEGDAGKAFADHGHQVLVGGRLGADGGDGCAGEQTQPGQKSDFGRHPWILSRDAVRVCDLPNSACLRARLRTGIPSRDRKGAVALLIPGLFIHYVAKRLAPSPSS